MTPLSQQNAPQVFGLSAASSAPATPLTTHLTHTSAMPVFLAIPSSLLPTVSPIFHFPGPFLPFYHKPLTAVLPAPPTTPALPVASSSSTAILPAPTTATDLPVASSSPALGVSSSSSTTPLSTQLKQLSKPLSSLLRARCGQHSKVWTAQEDDILLKIYIESEKSKPWMKEAQKAFAYKKLEYKQIENRLHRLKSLRGLSKSSEAHLDVTTRSIINHARHSLQGKETSTRSDTTTKHWTPSEKAKLSKIYKDRVHYENQGTDWKSVAKQALNRTDGAISKYIRKMLRENRL